MDENGGSGYRQEMNKDVGGGYGMFSKMEGVGKKKRKYRNGGYSALYQL